MKMVTSAINLIVACAFAVASLSATAVHADDAVELHVAAVNAATNKIYELNFEPPVGATALSTTALPPNGGSSVTSLVFVPNEQSTKVDLLAADTTGGRIVRYAAAAGPALPVWAWPVSGPRATDGMSVDTRGNLYVISSDPARKELWVLRRDPALPPGAGFLPPLLIDNTNFSTNSKLNLLETVVVRSAIANGPATGDLLVLISDGRVLRYSATSLQSFLAGAGPISPPQTLVAASQTTATQKPTGIALWPTDGTLLMATTGGSILAFKLTTNGSTNLPAFATGLGASLGKIKTFVRSDVPYVAVGQPSKAKIFEFDGSCLAAACNQPLATISSVSNPIGLGATDSGTPTQDCVFTGDNPDHTCSLLFGTVKLGVSSANSGASIVDVSCTIDADPRVDPLLGTCSGAPLAIANYCPNYGATVIPGYLCGGSGPSHRGFALVKSIELNGFPTAPSDLLVKQELSADAILTPPNPGCPDVTMAWAPLAGEGTIPEGNDMIELTSSCGSSRGLPPGHSLVGVGLELNDAFFTGATQADRLTALANMKLDKLTATVNAANLPDTPPSSIKSTLASCVAKTKTYLNDTTNLTPQMRYACAAHQAWTCDNTVNAANFGPNANQLSSYSSIRGRFANLILTIDTRLAGHPASTVWPLADPGVPASSCDPDTTPPTVPGAPVKGTVTTTTVQLSWAGSTDSGTGVGGYYVLRNGTVVNTTTGTSYTDTGLTPGTTYTYTIESFDKSTLNNGGPNVSDPSGPLVVTTLIPADTQAPTVPTGLSFSYITGKVLKVTWSASTDPAPYASGVGGYYVYLNGALLGSTTNTYFQVTLQSNSSSQIFNAQVAAYDKATPTPNVSAKSAVLKLSCFDADHDNDCEKYPPYPK